MGYCVCYHLLGLMLGLMLGLLWACHPLFFLENPWASLALLQFFFFCLKVEQIKYVFFRVFLILI